MIELDIISGFLTKKGWALHYHGWEDAPNGGYHTTFTSQKLDSFTMHVQSDGEVFVDLMFFSYEVPAKPHAFHLSDPDFFDKVLGLLNY